MTAVQVPIVFHVELRQFPHLARAFNLNRDEIDARIIGPWVRNAPVDFDDRRWPPERARLTVYEGPALRPEEIGLGRGWANATRSGEDVTGQLLADAERQAVAAPQGAVSPASSLKALEAEILDRCAASPIAVSDVLAMVNDRHPQWRVSDRIALAERSIWEMLHGGRIRMSRAIDATRQPVASDEWEPVLLAWSTWAQAPSIFLERP